LNQLAIVSLRGLLIIKHTNLNSAICC